MDEELLKKLNAKRDVINQARPGAGGGPPPGNPVPKPGPSVKPPPSTHEPPCNPSGSNISVPPRAAPHAPQEVNAPPPPSAPAAPPAAAGPTDELASKLLKRKAVIPESPRGSSTNEPQPIPKLPPQNQQPTQPSNTGLTSPRGKGASQIFPPKPAPQPAPQSQGPPPPPAPSAPPAPKNEPVDELQAKLLKRKAVIPEAPQPLQPTAPVASQSPQGQRRQPPQQQQPQQQAVPPSPPPPQEPAQTSSDGPVDELQKKLMKRKSVIPDGPQPLHASGPRQPEPLAPLLPQRQPEPSGPPLPHRPPEPAGGPPPPPRQAEPQGPPPPPRQPEPAGGPPPPPITRQPETSGAPPAPFRIPEQPSVPLPPPPTQTDSTPLDELQKKLLKRKAVIPDSPQPLQPGSVPAPPPPSGGQPQPPPPPQQQPQQPQPSAPSPPPPPPPEPQPLRSSPLLSRPSSAPGSPQEGPVDELQKKLLKRKAVIPETPGGKPPSTPSTPSSGPGGPRSLRNSDGGEVSSSPSTPKTVGGGGAKIPALKMVNVTSSPVSSAPSSPAVQVPPPAIFAEPSSLFIATPREGHADEAIFAFPVSDAHKLPSPRTQDTTAKRPPVAMPPLKLSDNKDKPPAEPEPSRPSSARGSHVPLPTQTAGSILANLKAQEHQAAHPENNPPPQSPRKAEPLVSPRGDKFAFMAHLKELQNQRQPETPSPPQPQLIQVFRQTEPEPQLPLKKPQPSPPRNPPISQPKDLLTFDEPSSTSPSRPTTTGAEWNPFAEHPPQPMPQPQMVPQPIHFPPSPQETAPSAPPPSKDPTPPPTEPSGQASSPARPTLPPKKGAYIKRPAMKLVASDPTPMQVPVPEPVDVAEAQTPQLPPKNKVASRIVRSAPQSEKTTAPAPSEEKDTSSDRASSPIPSFDTLDKVVPSPLYRETSDDTAEGDDHPKPTDEVEPHPKDESSDKAEQPAERHDDSGEHTASASASQEGEPTQTEQSGDQTTEGQSGFGNDQQPEPEPEPVASVLEGIGLPETKKLSCLQRARPTAAGNRRLPSRKRDPAKRRDVIHDGKMGEVDDRAGTKAYTTMPDFAPTIKEMTGWDLNSSDPTPGMPAVHIIEPDPDLLLSPRSAALDEDVVVTRNRSASIEAPTTPRGGSAIVPPLGARPMMGGGMPMGPPMGLPKIEASDLHRPLRKATPAPAAAAAPMPTFARPNLKLGGAGKSMIVGMPPRIPVSMSADSQVRPPRPPVVEGSPPPLPPKSKLRRAAAPAIPSSPPPTYGGYHGGGGGGYEGGGYHNNNNTYGSSDGYDNNNYGGGGYDNSGGYGYGGGYDNSNYNYNNEGGGGGYAAPSNPNPPSRLRRAPPSSPPQPVFPSAGGYGQGDYSSGGYGYSEGYSGGEAAPDPPSRLRKAPAGPPPTSPPPPVQEDSYGYGGYGAGSGGGGGGYGGSGGSSAEFDNSMIADGGGTRIGGFSLPPMKGLVDALKQSSKSVRGFSPSLLRKTDPSKVPRNN